MKRDPVCLARDMALTVPQRSGKGSAGHLRTGLTRSVRSWREEKPELTRRSRRENAQALKQEKHEKGLDAGDDIVGHHAKTAPPRRCVLLGPTVDLPDRPWLHDVEKSKEHERHAERDGLRSGGPGGDPVAQHLVDADALMIARAHALIELLGRPGSDQSDEKPERNARRPAPGGREVSERDRNERPRGTGRLGNQACAQRRGHRERDARSHTLNPIPLDHLARVRAGVGHAIKYTRGGNPAQFKIAAFA